MKVLIIGYGKMGREIESMLLSRGHEIAGIVDNENERNSFAGHADVAIEFSVPNACVSNFYWCFERQLPVVTGTTGWLDQLDEVTLECTRKNGTLLWGSNFSPGMNIFFLLNRTLACVANLFPEYSPLISETHHIHKLDKPSGTALTLADDIIKNNHNIKEWILDAQPTSSSQMPVVVTREGEVKGIHEIIYSCTDDLISIKHEALSRKGFAAGALMASEWLPDKKGVFSFTEYFETLIKK
jgi:4-hydroxy-tetrahydrodipicolinate reductase